jgi:glyoxylase-like metal-dependent hydrolase (beta-lactamase superfamily II)
VVRAIPERLQDSLPRSEPILAICAQGNTSAHVAEGLRRLGYQAFNLEGGMNAWGNHYEMRTIEESQRLTLFQISRPARGCLSYLLASGGQAMVVDAARHIEVYTRIAAERGWRITTVLDTHLQADHLSGGSPAKAVRITGYPYDSIHPDDLLPATFPFRYLQGEMIFTLGEVRVRALHLPGHTLGMTNPLVDERYLVTGDTLFINSIGRPDLGGRAKTWAPLLYRSLQRVLALPEHTIVLPAHFSSMHEADDQGCYRAPISILRTRNEGLLMLSKGVEAFTAYIPQPQYIRRLTTTSGASTPACCRWTRPRPANWSWKELRALSHDATGSDKLRSAASVKAFRHSITAQPKDRLSNIHSHAAQI